MKSLFLRIRLVPFLIGVCLGLGLLCFSVRQTLRTSFVARPVLLVVAPRAVALPVAHAHESLLIIRAWERAMDSLRRDSLRGDSSGRRRYDSILAVRPGILDSARKAEAFYSSQDH